MLSKHLVLFFTLISGHFSVAQSFEKNKELREIDSLIVLEQFDAAQEKTTQLYLKLQSDKKKQEQLLETQFRQALLLDKKEQSSVEPLQILLKIKDEAETKELQSLKYRVYLMIALAYEKSDNIDLCKKYLNKALETCKANKLYEIYSTYCIRKSSHLRFVNDLDSSFHYAKKGKEYAEKYGNNADLRDSYILLGNYETMRKNYPESLKYAFLLLNFSKKTGERYLAVNYNNISKIYLQKGDLKKSLTYNDSAYSLYEKQTPLYKHYLPEVRYKIFEALGKNDSAYHYFKLYTNDYRDWQAEEELMKIKALEEQYQNTKKEAIIRNKDQQMVIIVFLLGVIIFGSAMLYVKNRKINKQNKIIVKQLAELTKTLKQKQVLLSELQHRVKNNLLHVISILEMQKESVDFNNIDELIRGNQNRIHSMALLHKKLNVSDKVNDVDLKRYIAELAELVKESYENYKRKVLLHIECEIENISIEKALPIGLIITELVSNSMKYAFKKQNIGIINIKITKKEDENKLYYSDNGIGYNFNAVSEKGLGQEIIKGLIDQLDGKTETKSDKGFELTICFK